MCARESWQLRNDAGHLPEHLPLALQQLLPLQSEESVHLRIAVVGKEVGPACRNDMEDTKCKGRQSCVTVLASTKPYDMAFNVNAATMFRLSVTFTRIEQPPRVNSVAVHCILISWGASPDTPAFLIRTGGKRGNKHLLPRP